MARVELQNRYPKGIRVRVAVIVREGDAILLVKHVKPGREYWLVPGGGAEAGETMEETARREMREEVGLDIEVERLVMLCEAIDPGGSRHVINLYFTARVTGGTLTLGDEAVLGGARYCGAKELRTLETYPPVGDSLAEMLEEGFAGPMRVLGNTWGL